MAYLSSRVDTQTGPVVRSVARVCARLACICARCCVVCAFAYEDTLRSRRDGTPHTTDALTHPVPEGTGRQVQVHAVLPRCRAHSTAVERDALIQQAYRRLRDGRDALHTGARAPPVSQTRRCGVEVVARLPLCVAHRPVLHTLVKRAHRSRSARLSSEGLDTGTAPIAKDLQPSLVVAALSRGGAHIRMRCALCVLRAHCCLRCGVPLRGCHAQTRPVALCRGRVVACLPCSIANHLVQRALVKEAPSPATLRHVHLGGHTPALPVVAVDCVVDARHPLVRARRLMFRAPSEVRARRLLCHSIALGTACTDAPPVTLARCGSVDIFAPLSSLGTHLPVCGALVQPARSCVALCLPKERRKAATLPPAFEVGAHLAHCGARARDGLALTSVAAHSHRRKGLSAPRTLAHTRPITPAGGAAVRVLAHLACIRAHCVPVTLIHSARGRLRCTSSFLVSSDAGACPVPEGQCALVGVVTTCE